MKNLLFYIFLLISIFFISCMNNSEENASREKEFKWKIKIVYTDGSIDTLNYEKKYPENSDPEIYLHIPLKPRNNNIPCLFIRRDYLHMETMIATNVRRFEILEH